MFSCITNSHLASACMIHCNSTSHVFMQECFRFIYCVSTCSPKTTSAPSTITFKWRRCKDRPQDMRVLGQPVALNGRLYVRGDSNVDCVRELKNESKRNEFIMAYSPDYDQWSKSLYPPVKQFTIATLNNRLLVVVGVDNSSGRTTNIIRSYELQGEHYPRWTVDLPYHDMPSALTYPVVTSYQQYLVVACGWKTIQKMTPEVNILDTSCNR